MADPPLAIEAAADDGLRALQELVEGEQCLGRLPLAPPRELATAIWTFLHGLVHLQIGGHLHEPRTLDGDTRLAELLDLTLACWRPR